MAKFQIHADQTNYEKIENIECNNLKLHALSKLSFKKKAH